MPSAISTRGLTKYYGKFLALNNLSLRIAENANIGLLGPNGAGKTTLISIICGIVNPSTGSVKVDGHDIISEFRTTRSLIGLVPQELTLGAFDKVINTLRFSRGLFGRSPDQAYLEQLLKNLSLWDKRNSMIMTLSGGMKRRVLIGKALAHEPTVLFLDEPTAGVDVELRKDMWTLVRELRESGVTIILTTHYIEEAEEIADRVGVINKGELLLVDDKQNIMHMLGKKQMNIELKQAVTTIPESLSGWELELSADGSQLTYTYDPHNVRTGVTGLLDAIRDAGLSLQDVNTSQSSLEDIFVSLVKEKS